MLGPRLLPVVGLLLAGTLTAVAHAPIPDIHPRDAQEHEGRGPVTVAGTVVRTRGDLHWIARDGAVLAVRLPEPPAPPVPLGSQATATGRLLRLGGELTLWADRFTATPPAGVPEPGWPALAADPAAWSGRPILLEGDVQGDLLRDQDGHRIRLAADLPDGPFRGVGLVRYAPACLCHTFAPTA